MMEPFCGGQILWPQLVSLPEEYKLDGGSYVAQN